VKAGFSWKYTTFKINALDVRTLKLDQFYAITIVFQYKNVYFNHRETAACLLNLPLDEITQVYYFQKQKSKSIVSHDHIGDTEIKFL
jgi:hypothetical protein